MNYNPFDLIKKIYLKEDISNINIDTSLCLVISKFLAYDVDNLPFLKKIIPYIFDISADNYLYLLWLSIPKKSKVPYLRKINKVEKEKNELYESIMDALDWSETEMLKNKSTLDKIILPKKEYWKVKLGV